MCNPQVFATWLTMARGGGIKAQTGADSLNTSYEAFEYLHQVMLSPLLADTHQTTLFRETNSNHERMFLDLVRRVIKPTHFLEIGAHEAAVAQQIARALPESKSFAFEADRDVYDHFVEEQKRSGIPKNFQYVHMALSDRDGEASLQKQVRISGADADKVLKNNSLLQKPKGVEYETFVVPCARVDTFLREEGPDLRAVLRIDVEGLCYQVLEGSSGILENCAAVYAEVEDYEIWAGQKTAFDVYRLLDAAGFVPVSRDVETPGQYNVLWLKREDALTRPFRSRLSLYYTELQRTVRKSSLW